MIELRDDFELGWDEYWKIIDADTEDHEAMKAEIAVLNEAQLADFYWHSLSMINLLEGRGKTEELVKEHSQKYVDDIANWAVLQGNDYFDDINFGAVAFPTALPPEANNFNLADFAENLYRERYGKDVVFRPNSYGGGRAASSEPTYDKLPAQDETWKWFWAIVELGVNDNAALEAKVASLTKEELIRFYHTARKLNGHFANHAEYTDDAEVDISDDTLDVLSDLVIRKGEAHYVDVVKNPSKFPKTWPDTSGDYTLWIMAANEYDKRYHEDVPVLD